MSRKTKFASRPPARGTSRAARPLRSPIRVTAPRNAGSGDNKGFGSAGGNLLIPTAAQNFDRKRLWLLDRDVQQNVTSYGRRTMLTYGRSLYVSYNIVRGAVNEISELATCSFVPEYRGANPDYEPLLENFLSQNDKTCDIAGWPYTMRHYRRLLAQSILVDGDMGTLFCRDEAGNPRLQTIPGHRIGSNQAETSVKDGPFAGRRIIDGVIIGDYNNPIGYRILTADTGDYTHYLDVSTNDMVLHFIPQFVGQLRGFSLIGYDAFTFQDMSETRLWEMLAQKAGAGRVFQVYNQEGEPDPGADYINAPAAGSTTAGTPTGLWTETIDYNMNTYFKSSDAGARLEAVKFDRPSANQQSFRETNVREALNGIGWSIDHSLLPIKIGGAALRVLLDKLNSTLTEMQDFIIEPAVRRFDQFRIPVAMFETKELPYVPDWQKMEYQPPAKRTADKKYDSDVNIAEVRAGQKTRRQAIAERTGETEDYVRDANEKSVDDLFTRCERVAAKHPGMTTKDVLLYMESPTPNGVPQTAPPQKTPRESDPSDDLNY